MSVSLFIYDAVWGGRSDSRPLFRGGERCVNSRLGCSACHSIMNPLGFALENFDAVGRFRDKERDKPIDATGSYETRSGEVVKFAGAKELARFLANSEETQFAFAQQAFHHFAKQP